MTIIINEFSIFPLAIIIISYMMVGVLEYSCMFLLLTHQLTVFVYQSSYACLFSDSKEHRKYS